MMLLLLDDVDVDLGRADAGGQGALEQLGLSGAALRMHSLTTLLGTTVGALVDRLLRDETFHQLDCCWTGFQMNPTCQR